MAYCSFYFMGRVQNRFLLPTKDKFVFLFNANFPVFILMCKCFFFPQKTCTRETKLQVLRHQGQHCFEYYSSLYNSHHIGHKTYFLEEIVALVMHSSLGLIVRYMMLTTLDLHTILSVKQESRETVSRVHFSQLYQL